MSEDAEMAELDPADQAAVRQAIKSKAHCKAKQNIRKKSPIRGPNAGQSSVLKLSNEEHLQRCLDMYSNLPPTSSYARHKQRVLQKAISVLRISR